MRRTVRAKRARAAGLPQRLKRCVAMCCGAARKSRGGTLRWSISPTRLIDDPNMMQSRGDFKTALGDILYGLASKRTLNKDVPAPCSVQSGGGILGRPILGGLHHQYVRICTGTSLGTGSVAHLRATIDQPNDLPSPWSCCAVSDVLGPVSSPVSPADAIDECLIKTSRISDKRQFAPIEQLRCRNQQILRDRRELGPTRFLCCQTGRP